MDLFKFEVRLSSGEMSTKKKLLLFAAKLGYQTRSLDEAAKRLGVDVVFVTDRCHQLDDPWGDRAIAVHFESPDAAAYSVMEGVRKPGPNGEAATIDGILAFGDRPAVAAAYVARGLGLTGNHPAAVEACRSKLRMREVFRDAGMRGPWFRSVAVSPTPEPALLGISYPCVLKPMSLSASQGVVRANTREEFVAAAERIRKLLASPEILARREAGSDRIIVEEYIPGREVAVEGLLTDGELRVLAIFDKPDPLEGPYFEETIYVTPSRLTAAEQGEVERSAREAVRALGMGRASRSDLRNYCCGMRWVYRALIGHARWRLPE
jgi:biotin carboxylase